MHPSLHTHCTRFLAVSQCRAAVWAARLPLYTLYIIWEAKYGARWRTFVCPERCSAVRWNMQRAAEAVAARCVGHRSMLHHLPHLNVFPHRASAVFIPEA